MAKTKRNSKETTNVLVGFFTTESEKLIIESVKPVNLPMSEFIRNIVLKEIKRMLINKKEKV